MSTESRLDNIKSNWLIELIERLERKGFTGRISLDFHKGSPSRRYETVVKIHEVSVGR